MAKLNFSAKDILQKEFKSKVRGYDPVDVDEFLDGIIKDYETYNQEILALKEENQKLMQKVEQMSQNQATLSRLKQEPTSAPATNFDILKRISNLEKAVFGSRVEEQTDSAASQQVRSSLANAAERFLKQDDLDATRQF